MKRLLTSVFMVILILLSVSVPAIGIENRGNIQDDVPVSAQNITIQLLTPFGVENFTVEVSGEDIQNLNKIINETKWKLKNASSMFEVKKIFNETVERLADYGFLPRHRIKEIQSLVTDGNRFFHLLQPIVNKSQQFGMSDNLVCLVCGRMTNTLTLPPIRFLINTLARITLLPILEVLFIIFCTLDQYTNFSFISRMADFFGIAAALIILYPILAPQLLPLPYLGAFVSIGTEFIGFEIPSVYPSEGWLFTIGLKGIKMWNGSFIGGYRSCGPIQIAFFLQYLLPLLSCIGIVGFSGLSIPTSSSPTELDIFYLGFALGVSIEEC
ncbi:MAG: hypothetical protein DRN19_04710 [Thermoplasmata archaeon]|nr:MAG: hypothetical protein DRN19_04710 [Thermoplasmata archaeon]